jgi:branched-chain amino acid transport system substrate-binding protein
MAIHIRVLGTCNWPEAVNGMISQWQDGKQVVVWPVKIAQGKMKYPSFAQPAH